MTFSATPGGDPGHQPAGLREPMVLNYDGKSVTFSVADRPNNLVVASKIFDVLSEQLAQPNRWLQFSALHGLSHLRDPRTPLLIDRTRVGLADDEVRDYADGAAEFLLL